MEYSPNSMFCLFIDINNKIEREKNFSKQMEIKKKVFIRENWR